MDPDHIPALSPLAFVVTPALALLRAELQALEQLLPGHAAEDPPAHDARIEAELDNLPV